MPCSAGWSAIILAAGYGTRLRPLSFQVPKPLFPICNRPLLGLLLDQLQEAGCRRVAINLHYQAEAIAAWLAQAAPAGLELRLSLEPEILGTGGALRHLADFIGTEPVLVINSDIVTDLELAGLWLDYQPKAPATLVLHDQPRFNRVWVDPQGTITGFGLASPAPGAAVAAFTGIQIITPRLLRWLPRGEYADIIKVYNQLIAAGEPPAALFRAGFFWQDIGTPADYLAVHRRLLQGEAPRLAPFLPPVTDPCLAGEVALGPEVHWGGGVCIGPGVEIGPQASLTATVVWEGAEIAGGVQLQGCLVGRGVQVRRSAAHAILMPDEIVPFTPV